MEMLVEVKGLRDETSLAILRETYEYPHSEEYLSRKLDIPLSSCRKKIKTLLSLGLLGEEMRVYNVKGECISFYRSKVRPQ
ncbi:MAG: hypothetical protein DRN42_00520 [Thermoplasmata archaeon]|nr:MAG: hypothetical protein DRN42_00520 [Thermoplasmata archaeon]